MYQGALKSSPEMKFFLVIDFSLRIGGAVHKKCKNHHLHRNVPAYFFTMSGSHRRVDECAYSFAAEESRLLRKLQAALSYSILAKWIAYLIDLQNSGTFSSDEQ